MLVVPMSRHATVSDGAFPVAAAQALAAQQRQLSRHSPLR